MTASDAKEQLRFAHRRACPFPWIVVSGRPFSQGRQGGSGPKGPHKRRPIRCAPGRAPGPWEGRESLLRTQGWGAGAEV